MPIIKYQDDKYFKLMMLSLLIHDFIHDYGAISSLNRIKSLEEISQDIFQGNQSGNGRKIPPGSAKTGVIRKTPEEKQKAKVAQDKHTRGLEVEIKRLEADLRHLGVDEDDIQAEINEKKTFFNAPDSKFANISEYEYSPEIISFLSENVKDFNADTFSVDVRQPITRSVTAQNLSDIRTVLQDEKTINATLTTTGGINALLQSILIVYSYDNIHMIGLIQPIYQYIEQTTFRVMGMQSTTMDDIKKRRILLQQQQTGKGKGKTNTGGGGDGATLVERPRIGQELWDGPYEPLTQTVFEAPNKQVVRPVIVQNDNTQNVLDAIIDDKVENDNLRDIKSTEIYEALNMVGDENNELNVEYLKFVNKTVHQIIKGTYTFFLQREYTNEYAILNSHYLKQILMKYLLIVLHYPQINPKVNKYDFIIKLSDTFVNNVDTMLNDMCPLPNKQTGSGKKIKKRMLGGAFNETDLIQIDPKLKTMTVKRNQLIKRLTKLDSTIKQEPAPGTRRHNTVLQTNQGIQEQIDAHVFNFNEDVTRQFAKQSSSEESGKKISPQMKSVINLLCSEVAFNGLFYMGLSDANSMVSYPDGLDNKGNINYTIFNMQTDIINGISNGDNLSGIDDKLFTRIIDIPDLWNNNRGTNNYQQLSPTEFINNLNNAPNSIINNAIKKSRYPNFLQNSVCSTPQYIDAMGGLGSCTMKQINTTNNEFPSTVDITIQTNTPNYYRTFIKHDKNRVSLEFDYLVDGIKAEPYHEKFYLKDGKELLSASNTMNALSTKIMNLWNTRYNQDKSQSSDGVFQDLFKENFNQLISIASRKGKGDRAQEENAVFIDAGYRTATNYNPTNIRIGAMGDRPSGFRAMLDMKFLKTDSVRSNTIAGYFGPSSTTAIYSPNLFGGGKKSKKRRKTKRTKGGAKKNTRRATKK
jgi:hypothetical protein